MRGIEKQVRRGEGLKGKRKKVDRARYRNGDAEEGKGGTKDRRTHASIYEGGEAG